MANIKVSEMTEATSFDDGDYTMIVQANQNKKISKENMLLEVGELSNLETTNKSNIVNSINEVNSIATNNAKDNIYSLSETDTGKIWIDGKPIYRKVIDFGTLPNAGVKYANLGIENLERIIFWQGLVFESSTGNYFPLPNATTAGSPYLIDIVVASGDGYTQALRIRTQNDRTGFTAYIIVEYTKTTD